MAFSINTNITSMQAQAALNRTQQFQAKTINRVTTGLRIVNSGDDAAGLAVANGLRSDQAVLTQGLQNLNSAQSTLQTIDSGLSNIGGLLDRARTLATQSASDSFTGDRSTLNNEFKSVMTEIDRQSQAVGINVGGTFARTMQVFVGGGAGTTSTAAAVNGSVTVDLSGATADTKSLGLTGYSAKGAGITGSNVSAFLTAAKTLSTSATLTFTGANFSAGSGAAVSATVNLAGVTDLAGLAAAINTGIEQAGNQVGSQFAAFKAAGITAVAGLNSAGTLSAINFTAGNNAFMVSAVTGTATDSGANLLNGAAGATVTAVAYNASGTQQVNTLAFAAVATGTQVVAFSATDDTGTLQTLNVNLATGTTGATGASAVAELNTQLQAKGHGMQNIVAVWDAVGTNVSYVSTKSFTVQATGGTGGFTSAATNTSAVVGTTSVVDISTSSNATSAVNALSSAVKALGSAQAIVGKSENAMTYASGLASTQLVNLASSESQIRDADLAAEAANLSKAQILSQAGVAALAQANSAPQAVLSLLKG